MAPVGSNMKDDGAEKLNIKMEKKHHCFNNLLIIS